MAILNVQHRTTYRYDRPVHFGEHRWMFRPRDSQEQRLIRVDYVVTPAPSATYWQHDVFGNQIAVLEFAVPSNELVFDSDITLEHADIAAPQYRVTDEGQYYPFNYDEGVLPDLAPFRKVQYPDVAVEEWARALLPISGGKPTADLLLALSAAVRETCRYSRRTTPGTKPPVLTLSERSGTCRDFALLMIEAARVLGFAARFVTGYVYVPTRDEGHIRGGGATHAWVQVFVPGAGWVEYDPTNGIIGTRDLIRVGVARDPRQARPLSGSFIGDRSAYLGMEVDVLVSKVAEPQTQQPAAIRFRG